MWVVCDLTFWIFLLLTLQKRFSAVLKLPWGYQSNTRPLSVKRSEHYLLKPPSQSVSIFLEFLLYADTLTYDGELGYCIFDHRSCTTSKGTPNLTSIWDNNSWVFSLSCSYLLSCWSTVVPLPGWPGWWLFLGWGFWFVWFVITIIPAFALCLRLYMEYMNFLLAFLTHIAAEFQALTDHFCFIGPLPALTLTIILLFPIQSLHGTSYWFYTCI